MVIGASKIKFHGPTRRSVKLLARPKELRNEPMRLHYGRKPLLHIFAIRCAKCL